MTRRSHGADQRSWRRARWAVLVLGGALVTLSSGAPALSQTPQEHDQHHASTPTAATPMPSDPMTPSLAAVPTAQGTGEMGAMGQGMAGGQTCCGGAPAPSPLYPTMMAMPELTPEHRQQLERQAAERLAGGSAMMTEAFGQLTAATERGDASAMQDANARVREGLAQFETGLALRRALAEGRAPRDVALDWFRGEMNLTPLTNSPPPHGLFGLSWFHYIVMFTLMAFAITMVGMYFSKMRRAEALVARLTGGPVTAATAETTVQAASPASAEPPTGHTSGSLAVSARVGVAPELSKPNAWTGLLRVARIFDETPAVKTFRLIDPLFGTLPFTYMPGQFLTVTIAANGSRIKRSYTISSSPTERDYCEITVKREEHGVVSQFLHDQLHEDDTLQVTAPSGRFTFTGEESTSIVLIAGGVGVTPMISATRYLTTRSWRHDIFFVCAARSEADIVFREELEYLERRYPNLHVMIFVEHADGSSQRFITGRITREALQARIPDLSSHRVHICGPPPMMDAVRALLAEAGVPPARIFTEVFQGKELPRQRIEDLPVTEAKVAVVTFATSHKTAMLPPTKTVLEASEDVGVNIPYSCRIGTCGVCRTKLLAGSVTMDVQDGLEPGDRENNIILACQAKSTTDVSVEA